MIPKLAASAAAVFTIAATLFVVTQSASAHSRPIRFDPAPGAILTSAPATVTGWFNNELRRDANWTFIHVADAQGNRVDTGDTQLSNDRLTQTATLKSGLGEGAYTVTWRTYDDVDGAVFGDCFTFFVGQAAADQAVANKTRLDGGRDCQRIDMEAKDATPVAGGTPQAGSGDDEGGAATAGDDSDSDGIPTWGLALGVIAGLVIGGAGIHFVEKR
jgi:methionine-rich copper-binding protein CopC